MFKKFCHSLHRWEGIHGKLLYYSIIAKFFLPIANHFQPNSHGSNKCDSLFPCSVLFRKADSWSPLIRHFPPESGSNIFFATNILNSNSLSHCFFFISSKTSSWTHMKSNQCWYALWTSLLNFFSRLSVGFCTQYCKTSFTPLNTSNMSLVTCKVNEKNVLILS